MGDSYTVTLKLTINELVLAEEIMKVELFKIKKGYSMFPDSDIETLSAIIEKMKSC